VSLVKFGMWMGCTLDNGFVVTKDVANIMDRDPEVTKGQSEVDDLVNTSSYSNELAAIHCCFHCSMFLGVPVNRHLIHEMENSCNRLACALLQ
jgi:hypothetical protein